MRCCGSVANYIVKNKLLHISACGKDKENNYFWGRINKIIVNETMLEV
jgi:hypothetical protein